MIAQTIERVLHVSWFLFAVGCGLLGILAALLASPLWAQIAVGTWIASLSLAMGWWTLAHRRLRK